MATQFSLEDGVPWKKRFISIYTGQVFSLLGSQLVQFALIWYLTVTTNSATVLAVASLFGMLPRVILGPFIGPLVDRWDRRKTMIVADSVIAIATLVLALLFAFTDLQIWQIYILLMVRSAAGAFHGNAMSASTSLMVPLEHLTRVQGINQMLNGGLNIISAPLGAILYEALDLQWILAIDFITAVIAILPLFFFQIPQPDRTESEKLAGQASTYFQDLKAGFRYLWNWKGLLGIVMMAALLNFLLTPTFSLGPLLIKDHFGKEVISVGLYESVAGVGIILGGLLLSVWGGTKRKIVTTMGGIFLLGIGVMSTGFIPAEYFGLAVGAAALMGFALPIANGTLGGIMQSSVAPDMQGRVFSLVNSLASGMAPIGLALAGPVADLLGIQSWYVVAGSVAIGMAAFGFLSPAILGIESNNPGKLASEGLAMEPASSSGIQEQAVYE